MTAVAEMTKAVTIRDRLQRKAKRLMRTVLSGLVVVALGLAYFHPDRDSDRVFVYSMLALWLGADVVVAAVLMFTNVRCPRCNDALYQWFWQIRSGNGPSSCPHCQVNFEEPFDQ